MCVCVCLPSFQSAPEPRARAPSEVPSPGNAGTASGSLHPPAHRPSPPPPTSLPREAGEGEEEEEGQREAEAERTAAKPAGPCAAVSKPSFPPASGCQRLPPESAVRASERVVPKPRPPDVASGQESSLPEWVAIAKVTTARLCTRVAAS